MMTLKAAAAQYQIPGYPLTAKTLWKWATQGIHGQRLRHTRIGKRLLVRIEWIDEFLISLEPHQVTPPVQCRRQEQTQQRLADRGL
jgi:hypothetical protein